MNPKNKGKWNRWPFGNVSHAKGNSWLDQPPKGANDLSRIRCVKPEFFRHEILFDLELETGLPVRVAFIGLWTCCDREGRFKWRPRQLKSEILPYDNLDFSRVLDALFMRGFVVKYRVDSEDYGYIPTWSKHQVINNREMDSSLPPPPEAIEIQPVDACLTRGERVVHVMSTRSQFGKEEGKGKEGNGSEGNNTSLTAFEYSHAICQQAGIPATDPNQKVVRASIEEIQYREKCDLEPAASKLRDAVESATGRGEKIDRFWFENGRYKPKPEPPPVPKRMNVAEKMRKQTEEDLAASRARAAAAGMVN